MPNIEPYLSDDLRARLRAPVDLGGGARARVMQRVREASRLGRIMLHPRGMVRPTVLGALLAASFVVAVVSAGGRPEGGDGHATLADTIAMHFTVAAPETAAPPVIDPTRLVAVADETRTR